MTNKNITLNVWKNNNGFAMAVQGEVDSRFLTIKLEDDNGPIDLTNKTVKFLARKPDGNVVFNDMIIDNAENGITVLELTSQMSAAPGILDGCEVHIISENGETLIAKKINIFIQESLGPAVEESISEINAYQKLINKLHELEVHSTNENNPHNVTAAQVGALLDSTKYATSLSVDGTTVSLKDQDGSPLSSIETQDTKYTAGTNVSISSSNVISATDTTYSVATEQTDGLMSSNDKSKVDGIEPGAQANVQSDWNQIAVDADDYIKNKPTIPVLSDLNQLSEQSWEKQISNFSGTFFSICYGKSLYIIVGESGKIITSTNKIDWAQQISNTSNKLLKIIYENNLFTVVGENGTILTSPDGENWTLQTSGTLESLNSITYGNDTYVVVGNAGTILTSSDAQTWVPQTSNTNCALRDILYENSLFIAVGNAGTIRTSSDAVTWISSISGTSSILRGVSYGNNAYIIAGLSGTLLYSSNGEQWSNILLPDTSGFFFIKYINSRFLVGGENGIIYISKDGVNWKDIHLNLSTNIFDAYLENYSFMVCGGYGNIYTKNIGILDAITELYWLTNL